MNSINPDPLNYRGLQFSSGSPQFIFDASSPNHNKLALMTVAGTSGPLDGIGYTVGLRLNHPEVQAFLQPLITDSWNRYYATFTPGDANTDGSVNFPDLLALAQNYNTLASMSWSEGDFNGDRVVNFPDLLALAQNYGSGATVVPGASPEFNADWALAQSMVPEPGSLMMVVAAGAVLGRRRRLPAGR